MRRSVVRGFGYSICHVVDAPESSYLAAHFVTDFTALRKPVVAICGKQVRSVQDAVLVMQEGTGVSCNTCRVLVERGA
jgi:ferredoxin-like protein FixX